MRDVNRIKKTLDVIEEIWNKYPDLRLGQLIGNAVDANFLYYIEEPELIHALKEVYSNLDKSNKK